MNVSPHLLELLRKNGHECWHAAELHMQRARDREILERASKESAVLLTCDLDYGRILSVEQRTTPSVIIFRTTRIHPGYLHSVLYTHWRQIEPSLKAGSIVTVEDARIRIRELPIKEEIY